MIFVSVLGATVDGGDNFSPTSATFPVPFAIAGDTAGNLYTNQQTGSAIRVIRGLTGKIELVAGEEYLIKCRKKNKVN